MSVNAGTVAAVLSLDVSNFSDGINSAKAMMRTFKSDATSVGQKMDAVGKNITGWGKSLTYTVTAAAMAAATLATRTYANFEDAMLQVKAISGAAEEEYAALTEAAKEAGASTRFTAAEAANALNYMAMAGWKTQDMLSGMEGIMNLAAASGSDLATTSDIVTDALTAMGYTASDAGRLADVMAAASANANTNVALMGYTFKYAASIAGTLGYSMEDLAVATGLMGSASIKGEMAGTQLRAGMLRMIDPTDEVAAVMEKYGLSITNADGTMKSLMEVMQMYRERLGGLAQAEKAQAAAALFGMEASSGWLAIINASQEDFDNLTQAIYDSEGAAASMASTMESGLAGSTRALKSAAEGLMIEFGENLAPIFQDVADMLTDITRGFTSLDESTQTAILRAAAIAAAVGPVLIVGGKLISMLTAIATPAGAATAALVALTAAVVALRDADYAANAAAIMKDFRRNISEDLVGDVQAGLNIDTSGAETALSTAKSQLAEKAAEIYAAIQAALTDGQPDTPDVVNALTQTVQGWVKDALAKVDEWEQQQKEKLDKTDADYNAKVAEIESKAQACRDALTATEAETVAYIQSMAGKSTEYVQQHAGEIDALLEKMQEALAQLGLDKQTLEEAGAAAFATAKSGASKDAATYGMAASWVDTDRERRLAEAEAQGAADMEALRQAYAAGTISKEEYSQQEWGIQTGLGMERNQIQNMYETRMSEIFQGAIKAYEGPGGAGELAGTYAQIWMRDQVQAALEGMLSSGSIDTGSMPSFLQEYLKSALYSDDLSGWDSAEASPAEIANMKAYITDYIEDLETQIQKGMENNTDSEGLGIIQTILDSEAGSALNIDTSTMEGVISAACGDVGQAAKTGMIGGMQDTDGTLADAGTEMAETPVKATKDALESHSPSRVYFRIGQDMVRGMIGGVSSMQGALVAKMRAMAAAAANAARSALDIHSPSGVFRDIGRYVGKGFALGIDDEQMRAEEAIRALTDAKGAGETVNNYGAPSYSISVQGASIRSEEEARSLLREALKYTTARRRGYGL